MYLFYIVYLNVFLKTASASEGVWIGLNDRTVPGEYKWQDGEDLGAFDNWGSGQPNNSVPAGDRVRLGNMASESFGMYIVPPTIDFTVCFKNKKGNRD